MTEKELNNYLDLCHKEFSEKQDKYITKYKIGDYHQHWYDQGLKLLSLKSNQNAIHFQIIFIGTFSYKKKNWLWAWANSSMIDTVRIDSQRIKELKGIIGLDKFECPQFDCNEKQAEDLVVLALTHLNAIGMYRIPGERSCLYLAIIKQQEIVNYNTINEDDLVNNNTIFHSSSVFREQANAIIFAEIKDEELRTRWLWEQLWAKQVSKDRFIICCIPFYIYDLALGDEIVTSPKDKKKYVVDRVIKDAGHYTFRVYFHDKSIAKNVVSDIEKMGCSWETINILAIDAPSEEKSILVADYLYEKEQANQLEYETGRTYNGN